MLNRLTGINSIGTGNERATGKKTEQASFQSVLQQELTKETKTPRQVNFSKHAIERAEERGIELTPALVDKLSESVEKASEKGAKNILAFDAAQGFIINVPHCRVITTITQAEMKEQIFTNIDGATLL